MITGSDLTGVWLYAHSSFGTPLVSATYTLRLPKPRNVFAQISIARDIDDGASFGIQGGDVPTEIVPGRILSAFILRWSKFDEQGFGGVGFAAGDEPSIAYLENCVDITFQLDAVFRTGIATGIVFMLN
ncbi:MAG: hypothetical protein Q7U66_14200 [Methylobacter sp.]|nr:hypothetical protein [Methylobacter sp.]